MRLSRSRKILLTILLACLMVVCLAFGTVATAYARTVTMTGSNFFYANDGAKIYAYENYEYSDGAGDEDAVADGDRQYYTMFYMTDDDDNVTYRYNLAYHWFAAETDEEKADDSCSDSGNYAEGEEGWFSMVIGFNPSFVNDTCDNFETLTIAFQSQQYTKTEDSVTTNYITFVNNGKSDPEEAGVYVVITDDEEETKVTKEDFEDDEEAVLLHTMNGRQLNSDDDSDAFSTNDIKAAKITIEFTGYGETEEDGTTHNGEYSVRVRSDYGEKTEGANGETEYAEEVTGYFKNVGGNYSKRVNSTTAGVMPLTFSATFEGEKEESEKAAEEEEGGEYEEDSEEEEGEVLTSDEKLSECGMILFALNGQTMIYYNEGSSKVTCDGDTLYRDGESAISGSSVIDNAPPVLCLETSLGYLSYGQTLSFDYTVIDVLASSPKSEISYYVLTADQYRDTDLDYNLVADEEAGENDGTLSDEELEASLAKSPFTLTTDDNRLLVETDYPYLPQEIVDANRSATAEGGTGCTVKCLAKVCILLTDITSSAGNNKTTYVMLDWYVDDTVYVEGPDKTEDEPAGGESEEKKNKGNFIKVVTDSQGPTYGYFTTEDDETGEKYTYNDVVYPSDENNGKTFKYNYFDETLRAEYQEEVDKLAKDGQEYLLTAGSTSYFYLPAYNGFFGDNLDGYERLKFSIYYDVNGEQGSNTGLAYNALAISLGSEGKYTFTVYATDSSSNKMYYIDVTEDENGNDKYELKEFEGSDIYGDDDLMDMLPWFTFEVRYYGATIDDPETPSTGFVGTTYTDISFTINGISSYYETAYQLYEFDTAWYMEDNDLTYYSYEQFSAAAEDLFTGADTRKYFKQILEYADLNENDENYDEMSEYEWDSDALSFIPQNSDAFYMVRLTVTDTRRNVGSQTKSYLAIHVSAESSEFRGESDWARNNVVSIVLFCVAGVALIGIILVFAIRPKNEGDIDEQLSKETEKAKAKAEKKKKK